MEDNFNNRQNDKTADWQQLFIITENWQSDLAFFADETAFFRGLLDRYFVQLTGDLEKSKALTDNLIALDERLNALKRRVRKHKRRLSEHYSNPFALADPVCLEEHVALEKEMSEFVKNFRHVKKSVFQLVDNILKTDKQHHLISKT